MAAHVELLLPVVLGVGLAAATGFRVFLQLLITGLAARTGYIPISDGFSWLATTERFHRKLQCQAAR
jgi:hypothetical protein